MGGSLRDSLNALQDVFQDLLGVDERAFRFWAVVQRVGATNLVCRVCVKGDEDTGVPLLLFDPVGVRALVKMRGDRLDGNFLAEKNCGADHEREEEPGAETDSVPRFGCNVFMLVVDDELGEGDPNGEAPGEERDKAVESFQPVTIEADGNRDDPKGIADDAR